VVARSSGSKAPPPPPSRSRPSASDALAPAPSLASLAAPIGRASAAPPPPPSRRPPPPSIRPPSAPERAALPPINGPASGPPHAETAPAEFGMSSPTPSVRPPSRSLPPPAPAVPRAPASLRAYSGDTEDDAPTHLYAPASVPPPRTQPRTERPFSPAFQPTPAFSDAGRGTGAGKFLAAGVALAVVGFAIWYVFFGRTGALTVTVAGSGGQPVENIQILVDGAQVCDKSPCQMPGLSSGVHLLRVSAKGYQETADQAVSIGAGEQATSNITLSPAGMGTGVRVSALGSGLKLYVDGQEVGELPETVKNLTPGDHDIRVAGSDRYETYEEHLKLDDGEMRSIGPLKLRVLKGLATFKAGPGADGAHVLLDGRLVPELPATIEVPAGKQLTLLASKTGYETYRRMVNFDDGVAEKTFEITMVESTTETDTAAPPAEERPHSSASTKPTKSAAKTASTQSTTETSAKQGKAVLNMNSIPVSNVILNGRPLGPTPKIGVRVDPGPQTVVFVHPELGRKVMSATVNAGETKTFMARLQ